jgi:hypothetical protein
MKKMLLKMVLPIVSLSAVGVASAISITSCSVEGHTVEVQDLGFLKAVLAEGGDIANNAKDTSSRDLGLEESTDVTNSKMLKVINDGMNIDRASYLVCLSQVLVMGLLTVAEQ